jgi:hypothetical protein
MCYDFLPPYSPDFNPIENAFSAIKAHIRRDGDTYRAAMAKNAKEEDIWVYLHDAVFSVTAADAFGWFKGCSYV